MKRRRRWRHQHACSRYIKIKMWILSGFAKFHQMKWCNGKTGINLVFCFLFHSLLISWKVYFYLEFMTNADSMIMCVFTLRALSVSSVINDEPNCRLRFVQYHLFCLCSKVYWVIVLLQYALLNGSVGCVFLFCSAHWFNGQELNTTRRNSK